MDPAAAVDVQMLSQMRAVREAEDKGDSEIQQLYRGSVVFITGGTGFLGKQLIEKLLRACHGIEKIYLLTRNKKGIGMEDRLLNTLNDPVFDQLRKNNPEFHKRIVPVEGDIMELKLGLKDEDWNTIAQEVNFIYHVAATVLFNEPLKTAIIANVRGSREVITLARECHNLKSLVHVSTAYSHCNRKTVLEKFYPSPVPPAAMIEMVECMEESRLNAMTPGLTEGWPNTYTFSKAIAEEVVRKMGKGLPICIVRPSIVVPSYQEPVPGWLDSSNVFGPSGILLGTGIGIVRTLYLNTGALLDIVPVDYVNNLIIAASWDTTRRVQRGEQDIKIYTSSRFRNRLSCGDVQTLANSDCRNHLSPKTVWYPDAILTANKFIFLFLSTMLHFVPAFFIDGVLMAVGKNFRITEIYHKAYKLNTVLSHFLINTWNFHDENTVALSNSLSEADQKIFRFDIKDIDHKTYMIVWWLGLRKFIIKDGLKGTDKATRKQPFMKLLHFIVLALYIFIIWKVVSWTFAAALFCSSILF